VAPATYADPAELSFANTSVIRSRFSAKLQHIPGILRVLQVLVQPYRKLT
jgi:hypothetical protein